MKGARDPYISGVMEISLLISSEDTGGKKVNFKFPDMFPVDRFLSRSSHASFQASLKLLIFPPASGNTLVELLRISTGCFAASVSAYSPALAPGSLNLLGVNLKMKSKNEKCKCLFGI